MSCIYCKSPDSTAVFEITDIFSERYFYRCCNNCLTYFISPSPSKQQLSQAYGRDYYGEGESKFNPLTQKIFNHIKKRSVSFFSKRLHPNSKVLDIGCGDGTFLMALKDSKKIQAYGLEMEGESANRAARNDQINLTVSKFKSGLFSNESFDAVTLIHVFEHLPNPKESLLLIEGILKKGGILFIEIPNIRSLQFKMFKSHWFHLDPPRHLNMMDPNKLIEDLGEIGLDCIEESYQSLQFGPFGIQQSLLNSIGFKRDVLYEYLKRNKAYYKNYSKILLGLMLVYHWLSFPFFAMTDFLVSLFKYGSVVRLAFKKRN